MFPTIINAIAIILGTVIGILAGKKFSEEAKQVVFTCVGIISLIIGISMAIKSDYILGMTISLIAGGLIGTALNIEGAIYRFGEKLKKVFFKQKTNSNGENLVNEQESKNFAYAFLNSSVLFCVGAMAIVGSFKAGTEGDYSILLTKSIMDGFTAIMFASSMGVGVAFSAIPIVIYQGGLTLLSVWIKPLVSDIMIAELSATGGAIVIMIGLSIMNIKKIKTGNFLPAILIIVLMVVIRSYISTIALPW